MSQMVIATSTLIPISPTVVGCVKSWERTVSTTHETTLRENTTDENLGVTGSLQHIYKHSFAPILCYLHSDVEIFEQGWDQRVLAEFDDPSVGVVGFGGGLQHGTKDIYKTPYALSQLARGGYLSNVRDADHHGTRFQGSCDVAVLDGFCLVVRRGLLDRVGGWPVASLPFHCYDYWACITTHKLGYRVRLVGVDCQHHGGATSTTPAYQEWSQRILGKTDAQVHAESHRWIYEYGLGYIPWREKGPC